MPTRDEIAAEMARRGMQIPGQQSFAPNQIAQELERRNLTPEGQPREYLNLSSSPEKFKEAFQRSMDKLGLTGYKRGLDRLFAFGPNLEQGISDYERAVGSYPTRNEIGQAFGVATGSAPFYAAGSLAGSALPLSQTGQNLAGLTIGGMTSGLQEQGDLSQRLYQGAENAVFDLGTAGVIGGARNLPGVTNKVKKYLGLNTQELANKIGREDLNMLLTSAAGKYEPLFEQAAEKGITKSKIKQFRATDFFEDATKKERAAVSKAFKTNNLTDIHEGYKDLGKYISELKAKKASQKGLLSAEKKALEQAEKMHGNFKDALINGFNKADPELGKGFLEANKFWEKEVVPNLYNPTLSKYRAGKLTDKDLIEGLARSPLFRAQLANQYPEIMRRSKIKPTLKGLGYTGGVLGGGKAIYDLMGKE